MHLVMTGAAGLVGRGVASLLAARGRIGNDPIESLLLADIRPPANNSLPLADFRVETAVCDVRRPEEVAAVIRPGTDLVFHLAAIMSGPAETDFSRGWAVNLDGTRTVLEACRALPRPPRLIFASTIALYGLVDGPVSEDSPIRPSNSYGTQKAIAELMIADYSRRGFVDGRVVRIPHVAIRQDDTHQGAGGFITALVRGPLAGRNTICPVAPETRVGIITPTHVRESLLHLAELPVAAFSETRVLQLPAFTFTVQALMEGVAQIGGEVARRRIAVAPDPAFEALLAGIPWNFSAARAMALGFPRTHDIDGMFDEYLRNAPASRSENP